MRADGLAKALAGRTTLEEVLRVTPPDPDLARKATSRAGAQPSAPVPTQVPQAPRTPPKVLVLDDDSTIAEIAAAVLVDGYEVVAASHLDEGLRMVESEHPDVILVDLELPGADPGELLAILRTGARDLPVLVMSATDDHHTRDLATTSGATGFIPKPISEPELRREVAAVLQHRAALVDRHA
jgi:CheY-like chemotaxis protein